MKFILATAVALATAGLTLPASAQTFSVQAVRTANFLDSIGVNMHVESEWDTAYSDQANGGTGSFGTNPTLGAVIVNGRTYTNVSKIIASLRYLGINHARVSLLCDYIADRLQAITQGVPALRLAIGGSTGDAIWDEVIVRAGKIANQIEAVEGLNEAVETAQYEGLTGAAADCQFQNELFNITQYFNRQHGTHVPVLAPSVGGNSSDFGAISTCGWAANAANGHLYSDSYPPTQNAVYAIPFAQKDAPRGAPVWSTELGMSTNPAAPRGMNEDVAAKRMMSEFLAYFANHVVRSFAYELVDENPQTPTLNDNWNAAELEMHYGLFHNDWTPKESAQMIHAQSVLLADPGATAWTFVPQALTYSLSGAPPFTYSVLMQNSNGSFVLALWNEPPTMWVPATNTSWGYQVTTPATPVTVTFGRAFTSIQVADTFAAGGLQGGAVMSASAIAVSLTDHPVYLMLKP